MMMTSSLDLQEDSCNAEEGCGNYLTTYSLAFTDDVYLDIIYFHFKPSFFLQFQQLMVDAGN